MTLPDVELTDRQREVVELVGGRGLSYKRAAYVLRIAPETVRVHAVQIRDRMGVNMSPQRALIHLWHAKHLEAA